MSTTTARTSEPRPHERDFHPYRRTVWRVVEAQHRISTNRLANTQQDQALLEALIERVKPALPRAAAGLHFLLATPFRYGYQRSTRFRRAGEHPGIFYAAEHAATAIAEIAWARLYFLSRSPGVTPPNGTIEHTAFTIAIAARRSLDLTAPPFVRAARIWTDPNDYTACQAFAAGARAIEAQAIRYASVRDPQHRANIAILDPAVFRGEPKIMQTWHFRIEQNAVTAVAAFPGDEQFRFEAHDFGLSHQRETQL